MHSNPIEENQTEELSSSKGEQEGESKSSSGKSKSVEEFSTDSFLENRWERRRTHHSPEDVLRKPKRKSNWK